MNWYIARILSEKLRGPIFRYVLVKSSSLTKAKSILDRCFGPAVFSVEELVSSRQLPDELEYMDE